MQFIRSASAYTSAGKQQAELSAQQGGTARRSVCACCVVMNKMPLLASGVWPELAFRAIPRPVPVLPSFGQPRAQDVPVPWPAVSQLSLLRCEFRKFAPKKSSITPV